MSGSVSTTSSGAGNARGINESTLGEELWRVHLKRQVQGQSEIVPTQQHTRAGEELWLVHLIRSKGMEPSLEEEEDDDTPKVGQVRQDRSRVREKNKKAAHRKDNNKIRTLNLRSRAISIEE